MSVPTLFPPVSAEQWKAQIIKDLKGRSFESLQWHTPEGFTVEPFYTVEDTSSLPLEAVQSAQKSSPGWLNTPSFTVFDGKKDNRRLRQAIGREANALLLRFVPDTAPAILTHLLDGIKLSDTPVFFQLPLLEQVVPFLKDLLQLAPYQLRGGLLTDVYAQQQATGNGLEVLAEATRQTADSPHFRTICLSSKRFHEAGATATQELAFTLAALVEHYDYLTEAGLSAAQLFAKTAISVPVGTSYFPEIAKLRALRVLVNRLQSAWQAEASATTFIHAETSTFYYATTEPYTNLLRATTEAMAAVIGGCDALTVYPYDLQSQHEGEELAFAERIARNIPILLKEETHLDKVADPAAGAYALEHLTHKLVESAWSLFLDIEQQGGFTAAQTFIKDQLASSYQAKVEAVKNGKVLVGVTKFSTGDRLSQDVSGAGPRLAAEFELYNEAPLR